MAYEYVNSGDAREVDNNTQDVEMGGTGAYTHENVVSRVTRVMTELHSMKLHRFPSVMNAKADYRQLVDSWDIEWGDDIRYHMNTGFALVNQKHSEILSSTPKYDMVPMDDDAKRNVKAFKLDWDYEWKVSNTDQVINKVVHSACVTGLGWLFEDFVCEYRTIKVPKIGKDGMITFKEERIKYKEGCAPKLVLWENVVVNGRDMEEATQAVILEYYMRDEFFQKFGNNPMFSNVSDERIPRGKYYYVAQTNGNYSFYVGWETSTAVGWSNIQNKDVVSVARYYDTSCDHYIVLANNVWINPYKDENGNLCVMPNPYPHKEIPLVPYTDHYVEDDIYGLGEYDITRTSRRLKDETRSLIMDGTRTQMGLITIAEDSDWDETTMKLGYREFARVAKDDIGHFAPAVNLQALQALEAKADEDIIIESGVDFKNQLIAPSETATRTAGKIDASKKRINQNIKFNAYTFYSRLARLRAANMQTYYNTDRVISTPSEDYEGTSKQPLNWGYGTFLMKPKYRKGKFNIIPVLDSLFGDTTEEKRNKFIQYIQLFGNFVDPDTGKPVINPKQFIEASRGLLDDIVDVDKLLAEKPEEQTPDQIMKQMDNQIKWQEATPQMEPWMVPPSQRSGAPVLLASSPNTNGQ